jgi:hypothetical protein
VRRDVATKPGDECTGLSMPETTRDAALAYRVVSGVSRGEELRDVLARRANSHPDKIGIHGAHGVHSGTSQTYGA